uniref:Uncharacterized protein n=1 Tax=Picea sitchensis TaxID=3332 RepID=A0A6B9XWE7_PICSI|nr:hypothetical protein Q903MT_gene4359 [Picea sitchensis]
MLVPEGKLDILSALPGHIILSSVLLHRIHKSIRLVFYISWSVRLIISLARPTFQPRGAARTRTDPGTGQPNPLTFAF